MHKHHKKQKHNLQYNHNKQQTTNINTTPVVTDVDVKNKAAVAINTIIETLESDKGSDVASDINSLCYILSDDESLAITDATTLIDIINKLVEIAKETTHKSSIKKAIDAIYIIGSNSEDKDVKNTAAEAIKNIIKKLNFAQDTNVTDNIIMLGNIVHDASTGELITIDRTTLINIIK